MSILNFPTSPSTGDLYTFGDYTYRYDGEKWTTLSLGNVATLRADLANPDKGAAMVKGASIYVGSVAELKGLSVAVGHKVSTLGYYSPGDGGGNSYEIVAGGTGTEDGGSFLGLDNGLQAKGIFDGAIDVRKFGAKGDGVTDDTAAIQAAIDFGSIVFPSGTYMVNGNDPAGYYGRQGIDVPSKRAIMWLPDAEVKIIPSSEPGYNAFLVMSKSDVLFMNPRIRGDRYEHIGTTGEWGMGIEMSSASRVLIDNPDIRDCWGDGIYIGQLSEQAGPCKDIWINNGIIDNNRRQGMSVISVDGLFVNGTQFNNTNGTAPQAGVDFEPNHSYEVLRRVRFNGVTTKGNMSSGIMLWLGNLGSVAGAHIDMQFDGLYDEGSQRGVYIGSEFNNSGTGQIVFNNPVSKNAVQGAFAIRSWHKDAPRIFFNNPLAINSTTGKYTSETENSGFSVFTTPAFTGTLGGFEVHNYRSINDGTVATYAPRTLRFALGVENVSVSKTGGDASNTGHAFAAGAGNEITDLPKRIYSHWPGTSPVTRELPSYTPFTEVQNAPTKNCILQLPSITGTSQLVLKVVYVGGGNLFRIVPPSGQSLNSGGLFSAGMEIASRAKGSSAILRVTNSEWYLESYVGGWAAV